MGFSKAAQPMVQECPEGQSHMLGFLLVAVATLAMEGNQGCSGDLLIDKVGGGVDDTNYWNIFQSHWFLGHFTPPPLQTPQKILYFSHQPACTSEAFHILLLLRSQERKCISWVISVVHLDQYFVAKCDPKGNAVII